jgi:O-antigen/teichoic acid export membrane protein
MKAPNFGAALWSAALAFGSHRKLWNFALLLVGFSLGQGVLLVSQTLLVASRSIDRLSDFGLHFSSLVLAALIVDWGFAAVLAKDTVRHISAGNTQHQVSQSYWRAVFVRLVVFLTLTPPTLILCKEYGSSFSLYFALFSLPGLFAWIFNAGGVIDGVRMPGLAGITATFPYLFAALALSFTSSSSDIFSSSVIAASTSAGYMTTVISHHLVLYRLRLIRRPNSDSVTGSFNYFGSGFSALVVTLPGQLYFRLQLFMSASILGSAATGMLIYARQVCTAFSQVAGAIRRIEFPGLVQLMALGPNPSIRRLLHVQRYGFGVALAGTTLLLCGAGLVYGVFADSVYKGTALVVAMFAPTVSIMVLGQSFIQPLQAQGRFRSAAIITLVSTIVATGISYALAHHVGVLAFAIGQFSIGIIQIFSGVWALRVSGKSK